MLLMYCFIHVSSLGNNVVRSSKYTFCYSKDTLRHVKMNKYFNMSLYMLMFNHLMLKDIDGEKLDLVLPIMLYQIPYTV